MNRPNLQLATGSKATRALDYAIRRYKSSHWGNEHRKVIHIDDPVLPPALTELGKLKNLYIQVPGMGPCELSFRPGCSLSFDPEHRHQRLYLVLCDAERESMRQAMKVVNVDLAPLDQIARTAGGKQSKISLPGNISAFPVGKVTHVIYFTNKLGDGPSNYIHEFGEENKKDIRPILAVDPSGRLWLCGGNYTVPDAGITD